jgi:hypothetical protein
VASLTASLLVRGLVVEHDAVAAGVGRPPRMLSLARPSRLVGVVSAGEPATTASLLTFSGDLVASDSGLPAQDVKEPLALTASAGDLPAARQYRGRLALAESAAGLLAAAMRESGLPADRLAAVVVDVQRHVSPAESAGPATEIAGKRVPVLMENDANLGALGESAFGAGRGLDSLIYVKLGRNVGAGLILGGRLVRGAAGFAGELAHVQARGETGEGAVCICGGRGCLATLVGPSLVEFVEHAYSERLALSEVLALAADRDPAVSRVFNDIGRIIGRPLADLCTVIDPAAIVVDSTLGSASELVLAGIRESIGRHAAPVVADSIQVMPGELGEEAEALGAVVLARLSQLAVRLPAAERPGQARPSHR